ncbi:low molecular weight phosphotyrosine protein phosphatase [bacterium D16-51]|nr:low molecular weight phosphotyrosine protein phosphatase [bacterium D16-59]RKI60505.1 low molecular weight phosphotyrosine protein phosphatase [bacterium D16-51]
MIKILFVCHGNICRSPMAEYVMKYLVKKSGYENNFYIASAATSMEEIGNHIHYGTRMKMREVGIPTDNRVAVQMRRSDYKKYDYIIGMDHMNYKNILRIIGEDIEGKVSLLLEFAGSSRDIADPWYTGNFDQTYEDILEGCEAFLTQLIDTIKDK